MLRKFHMVWSASANARITLLRWRKVFIALMLAFALGSLGQTPPAQAGPARDPVTVSMTVVSPKTNFCVGQSAFYEVQVISAAHTTGESKVDAWALSGITVTGFSQDPSVGDIVGPKNKGFNTHKTSNWDDLIQLDELGRPDADAEGRSNSAVFKFKANKVGTTTLFFEGLAYGQYVSFNVPVKVIACKYEVSTSSTWVGSTPNGTAIFIAFMKTLMIGNDAGFFTSSGSPVVLWIASEFVPNYGTSVTIHKGSATLKGQAYDNGELTLNIAFDQVSGKDKLCGPAGCGGAPFTLEAEPVTITVPQAGGAGTGWHTLYSSGPKAPGYTTANVKPLDASK